MQVLFLSLCDYRPPLSCLPWPLPFACTMFLFLHHTLLNSTSGNILLILSYKSPEHSSSFLSHSHVYFICTHSGGLGSGWGKVKPCSWCTISKWRGWVAKEDCPWLDTGAQVPSGFKVLGLLFWILVHILPIFYHHLSSTLCGLSTRLELVDGLSLNPYNNSSKTGIAPTLQINKIKKGK